MFIDLSSPATARSALASRRARLAVARGRVLCLCDGERRNGSRDAPLPLPFIDESAAIIARRLIAHQALESAQQQALGLMAGYLPAVGVELWEGRSLVFRYSRLETPQTPAELRRLCALAIAAAEGEIELTLKRAIAWGAASLASQAAALEREAQVSGASNQQASRGESA